MADKQSYSVVRNNSYERSNFALRQRHNERENSSYSNPDIVPERSYLNIHFKQPDGSYCKVFDQMTENGTISTRGLKPDAKVFCEFVFDVNTAFFEEHGGYSFAKDFFTEAYRFAVKEIGGEEYVLSAVLHADERNRTLSEKLGHDVYHYHLHVVYVPVVDKEIRWSKRCKDESLRGTVKEVIHQVSRSKKWAYPEVVGKNGKVCRLPSYSLLQDRFHDHMKDAGFEGFKRGQSGSTAEHLSALEFKVQSDMQRLAEIEENVAERQAELEKKEQDLFYVKEATRTFNEIDSMGKKTLFGKVELSKDDYHTLVNLAKESISSRSEVARMKNELEDLRAAYEGLKEQWDELYQDAREYLIAVAYWPQKVKSFISDVIRNAEHSRQERRMENELQRREKRRRSDDRDR